MDLAPNYSRYELNDTPQPFEEPTKVTVAHESYIFWILGCIILVMHYGFLWAKEQLTKVDKSIHLSNMIDLAITRANKLRPDSIHITESQLSSDVDSS